MGVCANALTLMATEISVNQKEEIRNIKKVQCVKKKKKNLDDLLSNMEYILKLVYNCVKLSVSVLSCIKMLVHQNGQKGILILK